MLQYITLPSLQTAMSNFSETMQTLITSPVLVTILLSIAFAGLAVEMFTPGFGAGGILGSLPEESSFTVTLRQD